MYDEEIKRGIERIAETETSGPDDEQIEEILAEAETSGPNLGPAFRRFEAINSDVVDKQIAFINAQRGGKITKDDIKALVETGAKSAAAKVAKAAAKSPTLRIQPRTTLPSGRPMTWEQAKFKSDIVDNFAARVGTRPGDVLREDEAYYFSVLPIEFTCSGSGTNAVAYLADGATVDCFTLAIGDATTRLANATVVSSIDTNLSYPGQNTYVDQLFLIEGISARFRGMRIKYTAGDYAALGYNAQQTQIVSGNAVVWDDAGIYLPVEMFHDYSEEALLAKVLAGSSTLSFRWTETGVGDNATTKSTFIETFERLPNVATRFRETSGGAAMFDTPRGYIWTINENFQLGEQGGNGIFSTRLTVNDPIVYPFSAVQIPGAAAPLLPEQIGLYWEIRLHGTSLRKRGSKRWDRRVL